MASVRRVSLFEREIRWRLSSAAVDLLFELAEVLSEGERRDGGYFGSTMLTMELARVADAVREDCDALSARQVAELLAADPRVATRARAMAIADAELRAGGPRLTAVKIELRARSSGTRVFLDVDVEAGVDAA